MRVTGPTKLAGKYERSGALNGMPLYIGENGQRIWFDQGRGAVRACSGAQALSGKDQRI